MFTLHHLCQIVCTPRVGLYIDPGTGSMLFAVLIGLLGVGRFLFKGLWVKIRFLFSGGKKTDAEHDAFDSMDADEDVYVSDDDSEEF